MPPTKPSRRSEAPVHINHYSDVQPSNIVREKRKVEQWSNAQMQATVAVVERGSKVRAVARMFDIC